MMKIQVHPGLPPTPFMLPPMAAARSPPNAPAAVAAEKNAAARSPNSVRLYQQLQGRRVSRCYWYGRTREGNGTHER
jgi:hypothetical protein